MHYWGGVVFSGLLGLSACGGSEPASALAENQPDLPATPNTNAAVSAATMCESFADAPPAGTLDAAVRDAVDVYAAEEDGELFIVFTTTAQECAYRGNQLARVGTRELRVNAETNEVVSLRYDGCATEPVREREAMRATLTLSDARGSRASLLRGSLQLVDEAGESRVVSFEAPLCANARPAKVTCCLDVD